MADGLGDIKLDGKNYRIDMLSYRGRDIIDFAPRASVPTGSVVMSDLGLYQPLVQTDWRHGFGFHWYSDALGYMSTSGDVDTRQDGLAMRFTKSVSSDTNNARKDGFATFGGNLYSYGVGGIRKYSGGSWSAVSIMTPTIGPVFKNKASAATTLTISNVEVQDSANRLLLVSVFLKSNVTVSSITYGGTSMGSSYATVGTAPKTVLFKLVAPAVGTADVVITLSGSSNVIAIAAPFYNVDQGTPLGTASTNSVASGTSSSIVYSSATRRMIIDIITLNSATLPTVATADTLVTQDSIAASMSGSMGRADGAASVTTGWSWSGATKSEQIAVEINYVAEQDVNFLLNGGGYLFAFPNDSRAMKSTDGSTWTVAGLDPGASDFKWAIIHNGFIYAGKDGNNHVHYASQADLSDLEGTTDDTGIVYVGIGSIATIQAIVYAGVLYISRQDGLWSLQEDNIARRVIDYSSDMSSNNFRSMAAINGYLIFSIRDHVVQWNGARVADISPQKINDKFPYTSYGTFDNFVSADNFLYMTARTNETTYKIGMICWDGVGWHKLSDFVSNGTDDITAMGYDVVNNRIWWHKDATSDATYYIQMSSNSSFPYANFDTTGTHSLLSSRLDLGFRRVEKSMVSLLVEAENVTASRYIDVYYQLDGSGTWVHWDKVTANGISELTSPGSQNTQEFFFEQLRFDFITDSADSTPILASYTVRFIMRPDTRVGYNFNILAETSFRSKTREDERSAADIVNSIRTLRDSKAPIEMVDILGNSIFGYVTAIREQPISVENMPENEEPGNDTMDVQYWVNVNFVEL